MFRWALAKKLTDGKQCEARAGGIDRSIVAAEWEARSNKRLL